MKGRSNSTGVNYAWKDLTGRVFGRLTVLRLAPDRRSITGRRKVFWTCQCACGQECEVNSSKLLKGETLGCGCFRRRRNECSPLWKGGKHKNGEGYVYLNRPIFPGHESHKGRFVSEHIVVMSRHLGRGLLPGETVHHKNGIRDDNRLENLELRASAHGQGQRTEDLVKWAKEVLRRYEPGALANCV